MTEVPNISLIRYAYGVASSVIQCDISIRLTWIQNEPLGEFWIPRETITDIHTVSHEEQHHMHFLARATSKRSILKHVCFDRVRYRLLSPLVSMAITVLWVRERCCECENRSKNRNKFILTAWNYSSKFFWFLCQ